MPAGTYRRSAVVYRKAYRDPYRGSTVGQKKCASFNLPKPQLELPNSLLGVLPGFCTPFQGPRAGGALSSPQWEHGGRLELQGFTVCKKPKHTVGCLKQKPLRIPGRKKNCQAKQINNKYAKHKAKRHRYASRFRAFLAVVLEHKCNI